MKELVTSWVMLFVLVGLFFFNSFVIKDFTKTISDEIEMVKKEIDADNTEKAVEIFEEKNRLWQKKIKKMLYIYHHNDLENVGRIIRLSEEHIRKKEFGEASIRLIEVQYLLKTLRDGEKITLDNIF